MNCQENFYFLTAKKILALWMQAPSSITSMYSLECTERWKGPYEETIKLTYFFSPPPYAEPLHNQISLCRAPFMAAIVNSLHSDNANESDRRCCCQTIQTIILWREPLQFAIVVNFDGISDASIATLDNPSVSLNDAN